MRESEIYVIITQPSLSYSEVASVCIRCGVKMLQLREKDMSDVEFLKLAKAIRRQCSGTETSFVVNDRPAVAAACGSDYLHLGQDDMSIEEARKIVGPDMKIGLSTHSPEQVVSAMEMADKPDYIGFGPIFTTQTKKAAGPARGIEMLRSILPLSNVPVVAIGGISKANIEQVKSTKVDYVAMVSYFMQSSSPEELERRINELKSNTYIQH
ncbi:MAG: thiamine phosphate synthase [Bacteroidales bacterium]